jgi:MFS family permease
MSNTKMREKPRPLFSRNFATLLVAQASFGYAFSSFLMLPKFLVTDLGAGPVEIGRVMAVYSMATIASMPVMGVMVDRFGRRVFMTVGALLMALASTAYVAVDDIGPLIYALRGVQGCAFAMVFVGGATLTVDEAPPERLGQAIALFGLTMLAMNGVAAASVEAIVTASGWPLAFLAAAAAAILSTVLSRALRERRSAEVVTPANGLWLVSKRKPLRHLLVVSSTVGAAMSTMVTFHQPFALERGIESVSGFFVAYAAAAIFVRVGLGHVIDRAGRRRVAVVSLFAYAAVVTAMARLDGSAVLALLGLGLGAAHGFSYPSLNSLAIDGVSIDDRGKVMALFQGAFHVGFAGAALGFGALAEVAGYPAIFFGGGACALVGLVVLAASPAGVAPGQAADGVW